MVKDLKEIFTPVADRLKNPFFGSVAVSWLLVNWRVVIALIGYTPKDLVRSNANSYIQFVEMQGIWRLIALPILLGLAYVIINPLIKMLNSALNEYFRRRSSRWNKAISKGAFIPVEKYISHKERYDDLSNEYADLIESESSLKNKVSELTTKLKTAEAELTQFERKKRERAEKITRMQLSGEWFLSIKQNGKAVFQKRIHFLKNDTEIVFEDGKLLHTLFNVEQKIIIPDNNSVIILVHIPANESGLLNLMPANQTQYLKYEDSLSVLSGRINNSQEIEYRREIARTSALDVIAQL
ncbi:hypothetical protein ACQKLP_07070 [Chitinophaga sp. NPDC101104]|uniref:hypothetical protein n=1 Tax=Chitinophaga sp. NPDC101104 TaxID=3390561 RepID=UPI003D00A520